MRFSKYNCIDTKEKLRDLNRYLMDGDKPKYKFMSLDCESTGLSHIRDTVIGFSLAVSQDQGFYIPLLQWEPDLASQYNRTKEGVKYEGAFKHGHLKCVWSGKTFPEFVTPQEYNIREIMPAIPLLLERWVKDSKLLMWNGPYDSCMFKSSFGLDITDSIALDGTLLVHAIDENSTNTLKGNIPKYAKQLGINAHAQMAIEKKEVLSSIIMNGGDKAGQVWRADPEPQAKYAAADAFLTYGICEAALEEFTEIHGQKGLKWFFKDEVMPLCKEVMIPLKEKGMIVDVPHFEKLLTETQSYMEKLEDEIQDILQHENLLNDFPLGKPEEVSMQRLFKKIIELEDLNMPTVLDKKTKLPKPSLSKAAVKKAYSENPHWLFGHILGTDEMKYSEEKIQSLTKDLHYFHENKSNVEARKPLKRNRFNISSDAHLRWLFVSRLGMNPKILPGTDTSTAGKLIPSMAAEVLKEFMLPKFPWVRKLLSYKKLVKLESTYIRPIVMLNIGGWVYPNLKQNGTGSGRASCSGINLQTLPRAGDEDRALAECGKCGSESVELVEEVAIVADVKCRDCDHTTKDIIRASVIKEGFVAPAGYVVVAADFTSLEPKNFAEASGSESLKNVYREGLDLYSYVYCEMFDHENKYSADPKAPNYLKTLDKKKRDLVKVLCLGIPYGAGDAQVAGMIGATVEVKDKETGLPIHIPDMKEGARIRNLYLDTFPELRAYMGKCELEAVTHGYVDTIIGRRRHLPKALEIQKVLNEAGYDFKDLEGCPPSALKKKECRPISRTTGVVMTLTSDMLEVIKEKLNLKWDKIIKKGFWSYIRGLLKADLNLAKNHKIQGMAAHLTNLGMLQVTRLVIEASLDAWVVMQVHDEVLMYAREDQAEEVAKLLESSMVDNIYTKLVSIPMEAPPLIADNLKDAK